MIHSVLMTVREEIKVPSLLPQQIVGKGENNRIWVSNCKIVKDRERWKYDLSESIRDKVKTPDTWYTYWWIEL